VTKLAAPLHMVKKQLVALSRKAWFLPKLIQRHKRKSLILVQNFEKIDYLKTLKQTQKHFKHFYFVFL